MADVAKKSTIELPIHADVDKLVNIARSMDKIDQQANDIKKAFNSDIFKGLSTGVDKTTRNIKSFNTTTEKMIQNADKMTGSFNKNSDATEKYSNSISRANDSAKKALDNIDKTSDGIKRMSDSAKQASDSINRSADATNERFDKLKRTSDDISHVHFTPNTNGIDNLTRHIDRARSVGEKFTHMGWSMIGVTAGLGVSFFKGAKDAADIQQQFKQITNLAVTSGEKRADVLRKVGEMQKENTQLSIKYGISQTDLARGDEELVHAGYSTNAALAAHKTLVEGAVASNQSYNDVMNNVTNTLDQYQLRTNNVAKMEARTKQVTNEMVYAVDHGKASFNDFGESMRYVGATAHSTNQKLSQTMSALDVLSKSGQEGSDAGTGLRKILNSFGAAGKGMGGKSQIGVMKQLGLSDKDFHTANGHLKQIGQLMRLMRSRMDAKHLNSGQRFSDMHQFFGTTGQETALILEKNADELKGLNDQISRADKMKGGGYVHWLAQNNMKTAANQVKVFQQAWKAFQIGAANTLLPTFTGIVKGLDGLLLDINKMGPTAKSITAWTAVGIAAIGPLAFAVSGVVKTISALKTASNFFKSSISNDYSESMGKTADSVSKSYDQMTDSAMQYAKVQADIGGETYKASPRDTTTNVGELTKNNALEDSQSINEQFQYSRQALHQQSNPSWFSRFRSRFGGKEATGTSFGQIGDMNRLAEGGSHLGSLSKAVTGGVGVFDVLNAAANLYGINQHNAGGKIGESAGSLGGGALGAVIAGPIGAGVGSALGDWLGKKGGQMIQKSLGKTSQQHINQYTVSGSKTAFQNSISHTANGFQNKIEQANSNYAVEGIYKKGSSERNSLINSNKALYKQMESQLDSYVKYNSSKSKSDIAILAKTVGLSKKQQQEMLKHDKNFYSERQSSADKAIKELESAESQGGKKRADAMAKAEKQISKAMSQGSDQQKIILGELRNQTGKISDEQAASMIRSSYRSMKATIRNADSTYKSTVSKANEQYKELTNSANTEYFISHSITKKKYDDTMRYAVRQRNGVIRDADRAKDGAISAAQKQHEQVVSEARKQAKDHLSATNAETGQVLNSWQQMAKGIGSIFDWIDDKISNIGSKHKISATQNKANIDAAGRYKIAHPHSFGRFASSYSGSKYHAYALGRNVGANETALVNESGQESIYNARRGEFSILQGNAGLVNLNADDNVLTAEQTKQLLNTHIRKRNLKGYAKGMGGTINVKLSVKSIRGAITATKRGMLQVERLIERGYRSSNSSVKKQMSLLNRSSEKSWKAISNSTGKETRSLSKDLGKEYKGIKDIVFKLIGNMSDDSLKQFTSMRDSLLKLTSTMSNDMEKEFKSLVSDLNSILEDLPKDAKASMESTVNALNQGIAGIDSTLKQFGGNSEVLKPFHYAAGSDGKLPNDQIAMVNDATSGPTQEAVVRNDNIYLPKHRNQIMHLQKGDQVLNGRQTERLINNYQTINHYKKGSGVSDATLEKLANKNQSNPSGAYNTEMGSKLTPKGPVLEHALTDGIANAIKSTGVRWTSAMWDVINKAMGSGSGGPLYNAMKKYGEGHRYVWGADGPDAFDCSGLVKYAAEKAYHLSLPHFSGSIMGMTHRVSRSNITPGVTLVGNGEHIGVMVDKDHYFSAFNPSIHPNILETPFNSSYFPGTPEFGNLPGIPTSSGKDNVKVSGSLQKLAKAELGSPALKWITKNLNEDTDSGDGFGEIPAGDHKKLLEEAGIPSNDFRAANYIISHESGWNPEATNSGSGAYGLPQSLPGSKMASAGSDWRHNPVTQLKWMKGYVKGRYGGFNAAESYWASHHNYANGGWANRASTFGEVAGQPEVAINPQRPSADHLIIEAIAARNKVTGNSFKKYFEGKNLREIGGHLFNRVSNAIHRGGREAVNKVNFTPNITINVNGGKHSDRDIARLVREELQKLSYQAFSKMHLNAES